MDFAPRLSSPLVAAGDVPKTYEDLLDPKWAGKVGIETADVAWFAAVAKAMGEEKGLAFFRKFAAARPSMRSGHTLMAELVAAGDMAMAVDAHVQGIARLKDKGAPIEWKALAPTFGRPNGVSVAKRAEHPYAALLFVDFMLSLEGQRLILKANRVPASNKVDSKLNDFPYEMIDPVVVIDEAPKWEKLWSELFLKGQAIKRERD